MSKVPPVATRRYFLESGPRSPGINFKYAETSPRTEPDDKNVRVKSRDGDTAGVHHGGQDYQGGEGIGLGERSAGERVPGHLREAGGGDCEAGGERPLCVIRA